MKVRGLKDHLDKTAGKQSSGKMLTSISHWAKKVFDSDKGQYETEELKNIEALEKLASLGVVSLRKGSGNIVVAELTKEGKELHMDFMKLGYYL